MIGATLTGLVVTAGPAAAATGNIRPPFNIGEQWWICQGYNNPAVTHTGTSAYGLDLTGGPSCNSAAAGRQAIAPMSGTVAYYQAAYGNLCVNIAGGSYTLTHINSGITGGTVSAGQVVGTVAAAGQLNNGGVAHIHFQMWSTANCYSSSGIPFDSAHGAQICGAPDLTASGPNGGNGTWSGTSFIGQSCNSAAGPNLTFIKTANTSNGTVEVHWASAANNFSSWTGGASTWFSLANVANGTFSMYDMNGDGRQDLVYIKTKNTGNGKVELHWLDAANGFSAAPNSYSTWFSTADAVNGTFMMGNLDGHPDLVFIKTANTGNGKVELHFVSSANNYATWAGGTATWFSLADVGNGTFMMHNMDGVNGDDLVFVKTKNTGNGHVELHWLNAATGFVQPPASYSTWFTAADAVNGTFSMSRLDGNPDLTFIKTQNTGGTVEVHYATSANNYATWAGGGASWFSLANVPNGIFCISAN